MSRVLRIQKGIDHFFFEKVSARGFGLMRMLWGLLALMDGFMKLQNVTRYYSNDGILPLPLGHIIFRGAYRFSIFDYVTDPEPVFALFCLYLFILFLATIGLWSRFSVLVGFILMISLQERNLLPLTGGDTMIRLMGFLLLVAPHITCYSIDHFKKQLFSQKIDRHPVMSIWPYRMLLWQLFLVYGTTLFIKNEGTMWFNGSAVGAIFHHEDFMRWPRTIIDLVSILSPVFSHGALFFFALWFALLIPQKIRSLLPFRIPYLTLKQFTLLVGVIFHGGIFFMMPIGVFPFVMIASYTGLLFKEDFSALRKVCNWKRKGPIHVLYDGQCSFCQDSVFVLRLTDGLQRFEYSDFHNEEKRKTIAPSVSKKELDQALHVVHPNGKILKGFDAIRSLIWHMPLWFWSTPLFFVPGVPQIGRRVYSWIAARRSCSISGAACTR